MSRRRRNPDRRYYWLLLVLAASAVCFYILWQARRPPVQHTPPASTHQTPLTPAAPARSNAPPLPVPPTVRPVVSNSPPAQPVLPIPSNPPPREIVRPVSPPSQPAISNVPPPAVALGGTNETSPAQVVTTLEAQIALVSFGISPGSIDGRNGAQTSAALRAFQKQQGLKPTGWLDRSTKAQLAPGGTPFRFITITEADIGALRPPAATWLAKSEMDRLGYQNILEFAAETSFSSPTLIRSLNPTIEWDHPFPGMRIQVPDTRFPPPKRASRAQVRLEARTLEVFDEFGGLVAHFPCSIARLVDKRPVGELHITVMIKNPNYTFDPAVFPESEEAREIGRKLIIPPGPNNPVGLVWIGLDRPGYGIHGTPNPEEVGRTESHGCFRLANWNAEYFRQIAWPGMPIDVEP